ncbi:unnamed protein product [Arabis nemorensis]|uniref:RING-type domain-containing protein n=1 Tax=Arabis nemorensis TaxID=586526 RepID=A0A565C781_9BRAS|nr:unnamed protein product [Arabis nemorensis]
MESRQATWTAKRESNPTRWIINYESKTQAIDSKASGSFSLRIRGIERTLIRSPSGRESLLEQRNIDMKDAGEAIVSEIPSAFLDEEETCNRYVSNVLSKAKMNKNWIQDHVVPNISKDAINMSSLHGKEEGFIVEAEAEIVKETSLNNWVCINDYDSEGRRKPIEQDCAICLEELSSNKKIIMKLPCSHNFHRDCVLSWLSRKHSCPSCRDDINNPRPKRKLSSKMLWVKRRKQN